MKIDVKEDEKKLTNEPKKEEVKIEEVKTVPTTEHKRSKKLSIKKPNLKNIKFDKKLLLPICCAIVAIVAIIAVVFLLRPQSIDDGYFVSDENKDVITLEVSKADAATTNLIRTHIVYTYADNKITSLKTYYEYENNELANRAFENTKSINQNAESVDLNDKYIVVTAKSDQYESLAPSDIKQQAEAIRQFQAAQKESEEKPEE